MRAMIPTIVLAAAVSGCSWARLSGHHRHSDADPSHHHDSSSPRTEAALPALAGAPGAVPMTAMLYAEKAAQARREAELHEEAKRLFRESDPEMAAHCDRLARQLRLLAEDYDGAVALNRRNADARLELPR